MDYWNMLQEYTKSQAIGLINLVGAANNWKRKTRVDLVDRIEAGDLWWILIQKKYLNLKLADYSVKLFFISLVHEVIQKGFSYKVFLPEPELCPWIPPNEYTGQIFLFTLVW